MDQHLDKQNYILPPLVGESKIQYTLTARLLVDPEWTTIHTVLMDELGLLLEKSEMALNMALADTWAGYIRYPVPRVGKHIDVI